MVVCRVRQTDVVLRLRSGIGAEDFDYVVDVPERYHAGSKRRGRYPKRTEDQGESQEVVWPIADQNGHGVPLALRLAADCLLLVRFLFAPRSLPVVHPVKLLSPLAVSATLPLPSLSKVDASRHLVVPIIAAYSR